MPLLYAPRPRLPDRKHPKEVARRTQRTRHLLVATCATAIAAVLVGCAPQPVEESLRIEFLRDRESGEGPERSPLQTQPEAWMEIRAEVKLNRNARGEDDEAVQKQIDEVAAQLAGGTGPWHERFDRLRNPESDGIDLTRDEGKLARFERWAVMNDPGPALVDFFGDTQIVPHYEVDESSGNEAGPPAAQRTVTLTFRPADESYPTEDELAAARRGLLKVADAIVRLQSTVDEMWTYLEENPQKRRSWIGFLALGDEEELSDLEMDISEYEEELWTRLFEDMFSALWPDEEPDGDTFVPSERLQQAFDAFPARVTVTPDGEVVETVGFLEAEDGYVVAAGDISWAVADVLEEIVSPNFTDFWATANLEGFFRGSKGARAADEEECDRDCQLDEILALPFVVRPAEAPEIAKALEEALAPPGEYRLTWIRHR